MKEFGEPWHLSDCYASSKEAKAFNDMGVGVLDGFGDEFSRRIVACVNACAGMEKPKEWIDECERLRDQYKAQRDELLAALNALYGWTKAEVEHFGATVPDDFIIEMVEKAVKNA